jgi:membrane dipeptidase
MTYIIDSHEDIACSALSFNRDILLSAHATRSKEKGTQIPVWNNGETTLGWPDYQTGKIALIFASLFVAPAAYSGGAWDVMAYRDNIEAEKLTRQQIDYYEKLTEEHPDQFRLVRNRRELRAVLTPWEQEPESEHPVGLVMLLEGAEGLRSPLLLEDFYARGLRQVGPVWAGTRYCGGTNEERPFDHEGRALLEVMASLGIPLDISHMRENAALTALDIFEGAVFASHANARAMIKGSTSERHLTDLVIRRVQERGGVIGVVPFNKFLIPDWTSSTSREKVTLNEVAGQIDYYCQMSGNSHQVGIGSDFDGGFGLQNIPCEMDTISDLQKLDPVLEKMGYTAGDIENIFHTNWKKHLENILPE